MPQTILLFVHLQYDAPNSPQSAALRALGATVARTSNDLQWYLVGAYTPDDFDTDSLPLAVAQAVRSAHRARTDAAMLSRLQAHAAALATLQIPVIPLLRSGAPSTVLADVTRERAAALVLLGTPRVEGFTIALGGTVEAIQAAVPCPVRWARSPAGYASRPRAEGYRSSTGRARQYAA